MAQKKTPAPLRAGTRDDVGRVRNRAARERRLVAGLQKMRTSDPDGFAEMMRLLARLVARSRHAR